MHKTTGKASHIDELISALFSASRAIREHVHRGGKAPVASHLQLEVLRYVGEHEAPTMKEVAGYLCVTPPSATFLIGGLVDGGELARVADSRDRRVVRLVLTPRGRRAFRESSEKILRRMKEVLGALSAREAQELSRMLKKIAAPLASRRPQCNNRLA
ncbi:MAG: MarR family transcriptional regulator [Patescibacteria group bacterium]|nr:MarR family transcriptional regulator [Patescibacteria group bacterium]